VERTLLSARGREVTAADGSADKTDISEQHDVVVIGETHEFLMTAGSENSVVSQFDHVVIQKP